MRLLYLGETVPEASTIVWCLRQSKEFERIDHLGKLTLDYTHVSVNPLPDSIALHCDWEDHEFEWARRYSPEIPKIFIACSYCLRKIPKYAEMGYVFNVEEAYRNYDLMLEGLVKKIMEISR